MKRDYHGSRTYEHEGHNSAWTYSSLARGWKAAKRQLRRLLDWGSPQPSSRILLRDGEWHLSQLGGSEARPRPPKPAECPFPTEAPRPNNNWRVLP